MQKHSNNKLLLTGLKPGVYGDSANNPIEDKNLWEIERHIINLKEIPHRSFNDLQDIPNEFMPVYHQHRYIDLIDKPYIPQKVSDLSNDTGFITGINDLKDIPVRLYSDLQGIPQQFEAKPHTHSWNVITDKPTTFPPIAHTHAASQITSGVLSYDRLPIASSDVSKWNTAHSWGNHKTQGYIKGIANITEIGIRKYSDLQGIPTSFTPKAHTHHWDEITNKPSLSLVGHTHSYDSLTDKPTLNLTAWNTAYSWGNHASAGYIKVNNYVTGVGFNEDNGYLYVGRNGLTTVSTSMDGRYSLLTHNHDTRYAGLYHNHDKVYAAIDHTHTGYALSTHNHDTVYSKLGHNHDGRYAYANHNHDTAYSPIGHLHDDRYALLNHTHEGISVEGHTHDDRYSLLGHTHNYDNYRYWRFALNGYVVNSITSTEALNFYGGDDIEISNTSTGVKIDYVGEVDTATLDLRYAMIDHTHDDRYSLLGHTHDTRYSLIGHNHNNLYAPATHNHDTLYSRLDHNHDTVYAPISHNHDGRYYTKTEIDNMDFSTGETTDTNYYHTFLGLATDGTLNLTSNNGGPSLSASLDFRYVPRSGGMFDGVVVGPSFEETSLRVFKTNIKNYYGSGLDIINQLNIVSFDRKDGVVKGKIGVIADDSPDEILNEDKTAVDLYKTIFIQAKAIQELSKQITELKKLIS